MKEADEKPKPTVIRIRAEWDQLTHDQRLQKVAGVMAGPFYNSAFVLNQYSLLKPDGLLAGVADVADELEKAGKATNANNLKGLEAMLTSQAIALDAVFSMLASRAHSTLEKGAIDRAEKYLRLAMKAQSQSRATVETLANMKAPKGVAFVAQANIAHGHQQVNNQPSEILAQGKSEFVPNKLLTEANHEPVDARGQSKAKGNNQPVETLGKIHRRKNPRGQG